MGADFVAPAFLNTWARTTDTDRADQLIVHNDRKPARVREESGFDQLSLLAGISDHAIHAFLAGRARLERGLCLHFRSGDIDPALPIHAVHVDVVAIMIDDVDADTYAFLFGKPFAGPGNAFGRRQVDRRGVKNSLSRRAGYDEFGRNVLRS